MARERKPGPAAKKIIDMVTAGEATSAADAVRQDPSLQPGLGVIEQSLSGAPAASQPRPAPKPTGSGPALLER